MKADAWDMEYYFQLPEDAQRYYEVYSGHMVRRDGVVGVASARVQANLGAALQVAFDRPAALGLNKGKQTWEFLFKPEIELGDQRKLVQPPIAGWRRKRLIHDLARPFIRIPPDFVFETVLPTTSMTAMAPNLDLYREFGVSTLWVALLPYKQILVWDVARGERVHTYSDTDGPVRIAPFEDLELDIAQLFGRTLHWEEEWKEDAAEETVTASTIEET